MLNFMPGKKTYTAAIGMAAVSVGMYFQEAIGLEEMIRNVFEAVMFATIRKGVASGAE